MDILDSSIVLVHEDASLAVVSGSGVVWSPSDLGKLVCSRAVDEHVFMCYSVNETYYTQTVSLVCNSEKYEFVAAQRESLDLNGGGISRMVVGPDLSTILAILNGIALNLIIVFRWTSQSIKKGWQDLQVLCLTVHVSSSRKF